ncbi:MAG: hypothetical protein ACLGH4_00150 [Actinomycetes bacterium]
MEGRGRRAPAGTGERRLVWALLVLGLLLAAGGVARAELAERALAGAPVVEGEVVEVVRPNDLTERNGPQYEVTASFPAPSGEERTVTATWLVRDDGPVPAVGDSLDVRAGEARAELVAVPAPPPGTAMSFGGLLLGVAAAVTLVVDGRRRRRYAAGVTPPTDG